ncbi:MAG: HNH endonuclease [Gammaproteobacteria bacterium]|nr:HNH endonuclease [Gammaproteobacteria bacterium]
MPAPTPGFVKNIIRRCFREQVDKSPTKAQEGHIWEYFNSSCAYCGTQIGSKDEGHIDHLISASQGGANNISNRVLSCATCNEKEKLDKDWKVFLAQKVSSESIQIERANRIENWVVQQEQQYTTISKALLSLADDLAEEIVEAFDENINKIRSSKRDF